MYVSWRHFGKMIWNSINFTIGHTANLILYPAGIGQIFQEFAFKWKMGTHRYDVIIAYDAMRWDSVESAKNHEPKKTQWCVSLVSWVGIFHPLYLHKYWKMG